MQISGANLFGSVRVYQIQPQQEVVTKGIQYYRANLGKVQYYHQQLAPEESAPSTGVHFYRLQSGKVSYYHDQVDNVEAPVLPGIQFYWNRAGVKYFHQYITPTDTPTPPTPGGSGGSIGSSNQGRKLPDQAIKITDQDIFDLLYLLIYTGVL